MYTTMNKATLLTTVLWAISGRAQQPSITTPIPIIKFENMPSVDGTYKWEYDTANGIHAEEEGYLKNKGSENEAQFAQGCYSYTSPEGNFVVVHYTADENGFRPKVNILPPGSQGGCGTHRTSKSIPENNGRPGGPGDSDRPELPTIPYPGPPLSVTKPEIISPLPFPGQNPGGTGPMKSVPPLINFVGPQPPTSPEQNLSDKTGPNDKFDPRLNIDLRKLKSRREGKCEVDSNGKTLRCWCPTQDGLSFEKCDD